MVQNIHPRGVIWVPNSQPQAGHLSEKNYNLAVQYKIVHGLTDLDNRSSHTENVDNTSW